jgi:hypothetical protein
LKNRDPYAVLLISKHAYWLYAFAFDDLPDLDDVFRHPIFGQAGTVTRLVADRELTREFLTEQSQFQQKMIDEPRADPTFAEAVTPEHLMPHVRLLQVLDAHSLLISFGGRQDLTLNDIPRRNWDDRITMTWSPAGDRRIVCAPYPFNIDPLEVHLPVRIVRDHASDEKPYL